METLPNSDDAEVVGLTELEQKTLLEIVLRKIEYIEAVEEAERERRRLGFAKYLYEKGILTDEI